MSPAANRAIMFSLLGVQIPVWRARASQPESGEASLVFEPEARILRPRVRRAPIPARSARGCRRLRGVISFGDFSLDKQRKVTCRGSVTHKLYVAEGETTEDGCRGGATRN